LLFRYNLGSRFKKIGRFQRFNNARRKMPRGLLNLGDILRSPGPIVGERPEDAFPFAAPGKKVAPRITVELHDNITIEFLQNALNHRKISPVASAKHAQFHETSKA
jgi:hypothetical protein